VEHDLLQLKSQNVFMARSVLPNPEPPAPSRRLDPSETLQMELEESSHEHNVPLTHSTFDTVKAVISTEELRQSLEQWFKFCHPWFPILHRPSFPFNLESWTDFDFSKYFIIVKAIASVSMSYNYSLPFVKRNNSQRLRHEVIIHAVDSLSLQSLQAILIVAIGDLGAGRLLSCWNVLALARR
jgi:hypothetical protein